MGSFGNLEKISNLYQEVYFELLYDAFIEKDIF